jgi:Zn finger protein HypA/HybF involved in hydrogenase expression
MSTKDTNILLEITTKCIHCGDTIAVNSAVNKIWCSGCKGQTTFSGELWSLLLGEIISISNEMNFGEARNTSVEDETAGTVRVTFKKADLECYNCKQLITYNENDNIICSKCGAAIQKRAVSKTSVKKGFNFFINEDTYQLGEEKEKSYIINPVEISCTNCGGPLKADGTERLIKCSFCNTEIMIPDSVWYRLHPSIHVRPWYFVYRADMDQKITPLSFDAINGICCDEEQLLYCMGENADGTKALWAMSPQCELKWMTLIPRDKRWPECFSEIELLSDGNLLIWNKEVHPGLVYDRRDGNFIKELGGIEPAHSKAPKLDFYDCSSVAADPDGSIVCFINRRILRFSKDGEGIYLWPKSFLDFQRLRPIYLNNGKEPKKRDVNDIRGGGFVLPQNLRNKTNTYSYTGDSSVHISRDGSLFILAPFKGNERHEILGGAILTKFDRKGKILYKADLEAYGTGQFRTRTDHEGYAYVIMHDAREEYKNNGRIIRVSPDGSDVKVIAKLPFSAVISPDSCFTVAGDGTIYSIGNGEEIRIFNREGKYIWRNEAALKSEKKRIEDDD